MWPWNREWLYWMKHFVLALENRTFMMPIVWCMCLVQKNCAPRGYCQCVSVRRWSHMGNIKDFKLDHRAHRCNEHISFLDPMALEMANRIDWLASPLAIISKTFWIELIALDGVWHVHNGADITARAWRARGSFSRTKTKTTTATTSKNTMRCHVIDDGSYRMHAACTHRLTSARAQSDVDPSK